VVLSATATFDQFFISTVWPFPYHVAIFRRAFLRDVAQRVSLAARRITQLLRNLLGSRFSH
jgi:hypothetical protein